MFLCQLLEDKFARSADRGLRRLALGFEFLLNE